MWAKLRYFSGSVRLDALSQLPDLLVQDALLAIRQGRELPVDLFQLLAVQGDAQLVAAGLERVPSAVLAQNEAALRHAHGLGVDDLVRRALLEVAVLVDARLVREGVSPDDGLVGLHADADDLRE